MILKNIENCSWNRCSQVNSATSSMNFCVPIYRSPEFESWFLYLAQTSLLTPLLGSFTLHATLHAVLDSRKRCETERFIGSNWDIWYIDFWIITFGIHPFGISDTEHFGMWTFPFWENPNSIKGCPKYRSNDVTFNWFKLSLWRSKPNLTHFY